MKAVATDDDDRTAIRLVIEGYFDAFSRGASQAAAYCGEPALLVQPDRIVALNTRADIEAHLAHLLARLAQLGYSHSKVHDPRVTFLNATTALCSTARIRIAVDGTELPRGGATYLLRRQDGAWKIHALIATDADKLIGAD